jgi:hypothetical protein
MTRTFSRALVASLVSTGVLVGCAAGELPVAGRAGVSPAVRASASAAPAPRELTEAEAQAALVTPGDLGDPWGTTQGAATWRDGVLKATSEEPDCRRLLEALYTDDLFQTEPRVRAVTGLDDPLDQTQLRYQVLGPDPAAVDRTLAWMRTLPGRCGRFTAVTERGAVLGVQVSDAALPEVGDVRQGLRVTVAGGTEDGRTDMLTLDVVAVRLGDDMIAFTHGGLGEVSADTTNAVVQVGAARLDGIRKQGRKQV